ncbi:hypothetical protein [Thermoplasma volcanium GSS1]|uniref:Probable D-glycero-D-manno-heptose-1,7-bisphosphate 7-phosphatase n=2 Tax=Thermoplasma volcanium TaxID=50339 RepID=GMHB_THEVO|nr:RecName: Full=Probable D-glycero-D-manno-heptose-1,7-bisphosphate 7-phosphatase; AltName: Full=D,D-heptose 1,7-bisphosphate phosphatase; Short=HBP phosphatase [Thermoplasma volcanium GSS1]BAB59740.1 hypothetical protein [Thermoplasma volcanium GSS1]
MKTLFIDRDGTINKDCPYCHNPSDLFIYPDAVDLLQRYQDDGFRIIIVTNQSGIGRGYFTESQFKEFSDFMNDKLKENGIVISAIYYCPHKPEDSCNCRKPETGLFSEVLEDYKVDIPSSIVVGDRNEIDGEFARRIKLPFRLLRH